MRHILSFTFHYILYCIDVYHVNFHSTNITNIHVYKNTTNLQIVLHRTSFFIKSISKILHNSHCTDAFFFQIFSQFSKLVLLISLSLVDKLLTSSRYHVDFDCSTVTIALLVACSNRVIQCSQMINAWYHTCARDCSLVIVSTQSKHVCKHLILC